jgi:flagellar basal body-associated protein FliL
MSEAPKKKEDAKAAAPGTTPAESTPAKKKPPIKVIGIVAAIMAAEAGALFVVVGKTGAKPAAASAEIHGAEEAQAKQTVEIELLDDKFQNMQTGKVWLWDIQIVLKVKQKQQEYLNAELEKRASEIKEGMSQIMRRAQHNQLSEPELTILNHQIHAFLDRALGVDPEGKSRIERVLIPKCRGLQIEQ